MALSMPKDKAGQQKVFLLILPILILGGYWYFMHKGKKLEITALEARLTETETRNNVAKQIALTAGSDLQQKLALYEQHLARLEELIPKREEVAALLNGLSERAMDSNVDLSLMKPELSEASEFYTRQTYVLQVIGVYHDVGRYLSSIASSSRIVAPVELKLRPRPQSETRDGTPRLNADFRIITYVIPPAPEPQDQPAPPAGGASGSN